jgi:hypothetical protein
MDPTTEKNAWIDALFESAARIRRVSNQLGYLADAARVLGQTQLADTLSDHADALHYAVEDLLNSHADKQHGEVNAITNQWAETLKAITSTLDKE